MANANKRFAAKYLKGRMCQYLKSGQCSIEDQGSENISISGYTTAYESVDIIGIKFYLERYADGRWANYKTWPIIEKYNTSKVWGKINSIYVPKGYKYRLRAVHSVKKGNITETGKSYSSDITIK